MGILDLKNTISKIKASVDEFNSIIKGTEERSSEFKDRMIEITHLNNRRNRLQKHTHTENRASGNCATITKDLITQFPKEARKKRKITKDIMTENISNFIRNIKYRFKKLSEHQRG